MFKKRKTTTHIVSVETWEQRRQKMERDEKKVVALLVFIGLILFILGSYWLLTDYK